eukprot:1281236-Pyramimonas_sp.AAC.1
MASKTAKMASKMPPGRPRWPSRWLQHASKTAQAAPKTALDVPAHGVMRLIFLSLVASSPNTA